VRFQGFSRILWFERGIAICVSGTPLSQIMTTGRRRAGLAVSLVVLSACAHRTPPAPAPQAPARAAAPLRFTATAYCLTGITASGVPVSKGVVAADPAVLPLGTVIRIAGAASYNGTYRVLDTGARVRRRTVDLYIPDCGAARRFGRRSVQVTVIREGH
jgi:3D (Asp-Asp-Asp) domain-containing protein